jgi:predicted nucleic acid-binding protein
VKTYVDFGVLVKLYSWEELSEVAAQLVADLPGVPLTPLHELEIRHALSAQRGRDLFTQRQLIAALRAFEEDIREYRLIRVRIDWATVFQEGERLSRKVTTSLLCRSLDILHVAVARLIGSEELITGDSREARLSEKVGLRVVNITSVSS